MNEGVPSAKKIIQVMRARKFAREHVPSDYMVGVLDPAADFVARTTNDPDLIMAVYLVGADWLGEHGEPRGFGDRAESIALGHNEQREKIDILFDFIELTYENEAVCSCCERPL